MRISIPRENVSFGMFIGYMSVLALACGAVAALHWWRRRRGGPPTRPTYARHLKDRINASPRKGRTKTKSKRRDK